MKTILIALLLLVGSQAQAKGRGWFCYTAVTNYKQAPRPVGDSIGVCVRTQQECFEDIVTSRTYIEDTLGETFTLTGKTFCGFQKEAYSFTDYYSYGPVKQRRSPRDRYTKGKR